MDEVNLLQVSADVTEIQLYHDGIFIGAGSVSKSMSDITETDVEEAKKRIVDAWILVRNGVNVGID